MSRNNINNMGKGMGFWSHDNVEHEEISGFGGHGQGFSEDVNYDIENQLLQTDVNYDIENQLEI